MTHTDAENQPVVSGATSTQAPTSHTTPSEPINPKADKSKKMFVVGIVILFIVVLAALIGFGLFRVYKQAASDRFTTTVARVLNLPAFKVNDTTISYSTYLDDLRAIHQVQSFTMAQSGQTESPVTELQLRDQVIQRLVQDALIEQVARGYGVVVSSTELDAYKSSVLAQRGVTSTEAADKILVSMFGWNLATYEQKVMMPVLLYQKVAAAAKNDEKVSKQIYDFAVERAQYIIDNIKTDDDFTRFAVQYSEDNTARSGGDVGWFSKGDMEPNFEKVAFALKPGEVSKVPVETVFGLHIIKVDDHKVNQVKDEKTGKMVKKEQVKARHILIAPSLDKYLELLFKQSTFHLYIPVQNPFANK